MDEVPEEWLSSELQAEVVTTVGALEARAKVLVRPGRPATGRRADGADGGGTGCATP